MTNLLPPRNHRRIPTRSFVAAWVVALHQTLIAQTSVIPAQGVQAMNLLRPDSSYATSKSIAVSDAPFRTALEVQVLRTPDNPWSTQLNLRTSAPVSRDDVLHATFYLRRVAGTSDDALTTFVFERASTPWNKSANRTFAQGSDTWQPWHVAFLADDDYAAGDAQVNCQLGYEPQTLQLGGLTVTNYGTSVALEDLPDDFTYPGREPDAPWRQAAAERIELHRKADVGLRILNAYGQPVPQATVEARLLRHQFGFGSAVAASALFDARANGERYRQIVSQWFNRVVLENDLKWPNWESNRSRALDAVSWLVERQIEVRGHNLIWPSWTFMPNDLPGLANNPPALRNRINTHIYDETTALQGQIIEWDVINEPWNNHDVMDILGQAEMVSWFEQTHAADPGAKLFLNEYGNLEVASRSDSHYQGNLVTLQYLLDADAPVHGFGLQSHFGAFLTGPNELYTRLEEHAAFGLPLAVTEFDVDTTDLQLQADYTRDFLTLTFSHPAVNGVLMWGFWENAHWRPTAALFRSDWSIKPNGVVWSNLVFNTWTTHITTTTDQQGQAGIRGFKGTYLVSAGTTTADTISLETRIDTDATLDLVIPNAPPTLEISSTPSTVRLAWPAAAADFTLEQTHTDALHDWQPVDLEPTTQDDYLILSLPFLNETHLFRLRR